MSATISVIVPVYNSERFLDKCVQSVLNQTMHDFELILVDDGGTDSSPQMCDLWAERDSRIKVLHKLNGGIMDAVIHGIELASGEYTTFMDNDDWLEPEYLQILYKGITEYQADVANCNYQRVYADRKDPRCFAPRVFDKEAIKRELLPGMADGQLSIMHCFRWCKLYKTKLLKKTMWMCVTPERVLGENLALNFAVFGACEKIVVLDTPPLYNYFDNEDSVTGKCDLTVHLNQDAYFEMLKRISKEYGCYHNNTEYLKTRHYAGYIYTKAISTLPRNEKKSEIKKVIKVLDRKKWRSVIGSYGVFAERICMYLCYWGQIDLMLILVDVVKKIKGIR